jgi:hypothetical protein
VQEAQHLSALSIAAFSRLISSFSALTGRLSFVSQARAAGAPSVVVCGGVNSLGKVPLPPIVRSVVIARDADPVGSPADQDLYRGVVRRLGQNLKVGVTARPNDI